MRNKNEIENLANKELNRLSRDFELDLIRLLKTLSLISQSKAILEKHIEYLRGKSAEFQNRLSGFIISLLELEKEIDEFPQIQTEAGKELNEKLNRHVEHLKSILGDYITYAREMNDDLEKTSGEYINSLELAHKFYMLELQLSQTELDSRLKELESNLSKTLAEIRALENERKVTSEKSEKHSPEDIPHVDELSILSSKKSLKDFTKRNKGITFGLVSLIVITLFFSLWIFNNRRELKKIEVGLSSEVLPPNRVSKEAAVEFNKKEEKRMSEDKTAQEKTEEAKEKIQQPPSQKKLLTVIGAGAYIRGGPGIDYPIFSVVKEGEVFERLDGEHGKWIKIKTRDGTVGWISKRLVKEIGE